VLTTDPVMNIRLACAGAGVTMVREDRVRDELASGALVMVLEQFSMPFPGYYLYFPQRRQASPALRALVDYLREARRQPSRRMAAPTGGRAPVKGARSGRDGRRR
jgi:DNA-binding transcriptional LysR family regulator